MTGGQVSKDINADKEFVGDVVSGILDKSGRLTQFVIGDENARKVSEFEAKVVGEVKEFVAPVTKPLAEVFDATGRSLTEGQKTLVKFGVGATELLGVKEIGKSLIKSFDLPKQTMLTSEQLNGLKTPTRGETLSGFEVKPYWEALPEKPLFESKVVKVGDEAGFESVDHNIDNFHNNPLFDKPRVNSARKLDAYHNFNEIIDNYGGLGHKFEIPSVGPDNKINRYSELIQVKGGYEGEKGIFEWIVDQGKITHRVFIKNGKITGYPNQFSKKGKK